MQWHTQQQLFFQLKYGLLQTRIHVFLNEELLAFEKCPVQMETEIKIIHLKGGSHQGTGRIHGN